MGQDDWYSKPVRIRVMDTQIQLSAMSLRTPVDAEPVRSREAMMEPAQSIQRNGGMIIVAWQLIRGEKKEEEGEGEFV
jgi:hypothetical protein